MYQGVGVGESGEWGVDGNSVSRKPKIANWRWGLRKTEREPTCSVICARYTWSCEKLKNPTSSGVSGLYDAHTHTHTHTHTQVKSSWLGAVQLGQLGPLIQMLGVWGFVDFVFNFQLFNFSTFKCLCVRRFKNHNRIHQLKKSTEGLCLPHPT